ncbi:MAG: hypothetical protein HDR10_06385 [Lachnospiraceae bacterium]|nr:hypothetical protein [Lachnospiraceae bacterium]
MKQTTERKIKILLMVCMILIMAVFTGCNQKTEYEGGHIALSYGSNWELSYQEAEPYPVFDLYAEEAEIIIMIIENDGSILDSFHNDMVSLMSTEGEIEEKGITDEWDKKGITYYEDMLSGQEDSYDMVLYGKAQEDKLIVCYGEFTGKEPAKLKKEAMEILSLLTFSDQEEIGELEQKEEQESILIIYEMLNTLLKYKAGGDDVNTAEVNETDKPGETQPAEKIEAFSEEEIKNLTYIEKISIEDYYGDKATYDIYGFKGSDNEDGYVSYFGPGFYYSAMVYPMGSDAFLYLSFDEFINFTMEDWEQEGSGYSDIKTGEIQSNGDDRYVVATAMKEDFYGTPYEFKEVFYLQKTAEGVGVIWQLEVSENGVEEETYLMIDELAGCYGISLDQIKASGDFEENNQKRLMEEQDNYEPEEGEPALEKVDGYRYMGMTTISAEASGKEAQCQVMVPMGRSSSVRENHAGANMHGVRVRAYIDILLQQNLMATMKLNSDIRYKSYVEDEERTRNVWKSEMIPMDAFEEAYYVVITYEEKDHLTEEFVPKTDVMCNIRINDDFALIYEITFTDSEYDDSTDTVIKELETAYEIDLSEYYYENHQ